MKTFLILWYVRMLNTVERLCMVSDTTIKLLYLPGINNLRWFNTKAKAHREYYKAIKNVPAYKNFIETNGNRSARFHLFSRNTSEIPYTDKENYVKKYSIEERCVNGIIPMKGVIVDESSGSSGTATNWVRGEVERKRNMRLIMFGIRQLLGYKPLFVINAFALGPWATGVNITMSCVRFSKLKSLGPDKTKIENTLKFFGTSHHYVIMGYPPFLKSLIDGSDINWKDYNITLIFGGESMSEGMRDYLLSRGIKKVYSSYGASDLELNIAHENDFTISLRRLLRENESLRKKLLKYDGALPMVFQFKQSDFLIESNEEGELIVTICRPGYTAPKIRYNIHDKGHVLSVAEVYKTLKELGIDTDKLIKPRTDIPLLFHYGRADMTVSFFGANISPVDIQEVLYSMPDLAQKTNSFCINITEDQSANKQLTISLELSQTFNYHAPLDDLSHEFFSNLSKTNQDFREAIKMIPPSSKPTLQFYEYATGPFSSNDIRIKSKYIIEGSHAV